MEHPNNQYPLNWKSSPIGEITIHKRRPNGSWGIQLNLDLEILPEDNDFQRFTGNIGSRPEVLAIKEAIEKVFNEHKDAVALYVVLPSNRPDLIRIFEASKFKKSGIITTATGTSVRLEITR